MSSKVLIIGAGFAGCNAAHILSEKDQIGLLISSKAVEL